MGARILIVDDNDVNRDLVRTVLSLHGHAVLEALDGASGLQTIRETPVDLAIVDVLMPGMDGYDLVREIRADRRIATTRVLFYTANYLEAEALPIARAFGVGRVVQKTGDLGALLDAVNTVLAEPQRPAVAVTDADFGREHLRVLNATLLAKIDELEQKQRLHQLVEATVSVGDDLSLPATLERIVTAARSLVGAARVAVQLVDVDGRPGACALIVDETATFSARCDGSCLPADPALSVAIRIEGNPDGRLHLAAKSDGSPYRSDDENLVVSLAGAAGRAVTNAQRYERARRREAWLSASVEVTSALLAAEPSEALHLVARGARRVADASAAWILLPAANDMVTVAARDGDAVDSDTDLLPRQDAGIYDEVARTGQPVLVDDLMTDDRTAPYLREALGIGPLLAVPLLGGSRYLGSLLIGKPSSSIGFSSTDVTMASAFAGHAALSLEFARAVEDRHRLLLLEERDRIARDLHDIVIQRVYAAGLRLEGVRSAVSETAASTIAGTIDELDQTISDVRQAIFSLRPGAGMSLRARVLDTVGKAAEVLGFTPRLRIEGPLDSVPSRIQVDAIATLGEALSNVARHSRASAVQVLVRADASELLLQVTDDGRGLPPVRQESGLANLAGRAAGLGGRMRLDSGPEGRGLQLSWYAPTGDSEPAVADIESMSAVATTTHGDVPTRNNGAGAA